MNAKTDIVELRQLLDEVDAQDGGLDARRLAERVGQNFG